MRPEIWAVQVSVYTQGPELHLDVPALQRQLQPKTCNSCLHRPCSRKFWRWYVPKWLDLFKIWPGLLRWPGDTDNTSHVGGGALLRSMRHDFNVPYINRSIYQKKNLNCKPILNNICSPDQLLHTSIYYWSIGNCVTNLLYRSINVVNYRAKLNYIWFKVQLNYNWISASFSNSFVP